MVERKISKFLAGNIGLVVSLALFGCSQTTVGSHNITPLPSIETQNSSTQQSSVSQRSDFAKPTAYSQLLIATHSLSDIDKASSWHKLTQQNPSAVTANKATTLADLDYCKTATIDHFIIPLLNSNGFDVHSMREIEQLPEHVQRKMGATIDKDVMTPKTANTYLINCMADKDYYYD